ncbi:MAG: 50S ribosomal protein L31, partial [Chloroflexi bacterium]|nr:50S ribosomal protein L31 [Chloroflexota bacterium]
CLSTGEQRVVDAAGRVDRFMRRLRTGQEHQAAADRRRADRRAPKQPSLINGIYGEDA